MAQPFDAAQLKLAGDAFPLAEGLRTNTALGRSAFSVSDNGVLSYRLGNSGTNNELVWFDRAGKRLVVAGQPSDHRGIALSPDQKQIAVHRHDNAGGDVWLVDLARDDALTRFTFNPAQHYSSPLWSSDGTRVAFTAGNAGTIYHKTSNGAGAEEVLLKSEQQPLLWSLSNDGKFILYEITDPKTKVDLWVMPLTGDRKPSPFLQTEFNERHAQFSTDGRWVAYSSDESGKPEVYVQSFPTASGKWKISTNGGSLPRWRKDGKEIFFVTPDRKLWSVAVRSAQAAFEAAVPNLLFESRITAPSSNFFPYDVSADGQRFLITSTPGEGGASAEPLTVILNWNAGLNPKP